MSDRFGNIPIQPPESAQPDQKPPKKAARVTISQKRASRVPAGKTTKRTRRSTVNTSGWLVAVLIVFALFATYCSLGFIGVPYYVTKIFPKQFHKDTGMVLEPTSVSFNPFTFRFTTGPVRLFMKPDKPIMSLHSLSADIAPSGIFGLDLVCSTITVDELNLNINRELDGSYNFQSIFGAENGKNLSEKLDFSNFPLSFSLNNISITNSSIIFNDAPTGKIHTVEKIQLELPTFSNIPLQKDQYLRPHFSAVINGSPVELTGQAVLGKKGGNQTTKLSMDIHDLDLTLYSSYLPFNLPLDIKKGKADGAVNIFFNPQTTNGDKLSIGFQLQLSGTELFGENNSTTILVPSARLNGTLQPISRIVHFTEIAMKEPAISTLSNSVHENSNQSQKQNSRISPTASSGNGSAENLPYKLMIDGLLVDNGTVRFMQSEKGQKTTSIWKSLQISLKDYHFASVKQAGPNKGSFSLSGEREGTPTNFSWHGSFTSPESWTGTLTLQKMDSDDLLKTIDPGNPFSIKGIANLEGQLTLSSNSEQLSSISYKLSDAELTIEKFRLMDGKENVLSAPVAKFAPLSVANKAVNFGNAQFQKASAQFTYGRVPGFFTAFNSTTYKLQGIDFEGGISCTFPQKKSQAPLAFTEVSLKANKLDAVRNTSDNFSFTGQTAASGLIKAKGIFALAPFSLSVKTGFRELPAKNVLLFFNPSPLLSDIVGNLSGKGDFKLPAKDFSGEIRLTDFFNKKPKEATFSWQQAIFQDVHYTAKPFHLAITSANINQALFAWDITKSDNGPMAYLSQVFHKYLPSTDRQSSGIDLQEIDFNDSKIHINDHRLVPDWQADAVEVSGKIQEILSKNGKSTFSLSGKLDDAPFTIDGTINPFSERNNGEFQFSLENYPLMSFQKQLASKTDIDTDSGDFKLTLKCDWQDRQYERSGIVTFTDVKPIDKTSDSALPLALLTGTDNSFQLQFDFFETEPVAKTSLFDEILTSFQTQVVKGAVSPLLLATGDFTDLIGNEYVEFSPGEFLLTDRGREVLIRYGALLQAHPLVGLILSGGVDPKVDREAMYQQLTAIEQQRVEEENKKLFAIWQEKRNQYEKNLAEKQKHSESAGKIMEQDIPPDVLTGFTPIRPEPIVVDKAMLLELAQKRLNIIHEYFTTQLALQPERISVVTPGDLPKTSENSINGVSISLTPVNGK